MSVCVCLYMCMHAHKDDCVTSEHEITCTLYRSPGGLEDVKDINMTLLRIFFDIATCATIWNLYTTN